MQENARLPARQRELYGNDQPLAAKRRTACGYLREDMGSGYVRILWELCAEAELLAGVSESDAPHFEALEAVAEVIERLRRTRAAASVTEP